MCVVDWVVRGDCLPDTLCLELFMSVTFIHSVQERSWLVRVYDSGWLVVIVRGGESLAVGSLGSAL